MNKKISNDKLEVEISTLGGEIQSIKDKTGCEYLWQGDSKYWAKKAINLFPYVGRLTEKSYYYKEKLYSMNIHGFLYTSEMQVVNEADSEITFSLSSNDETKKEYPFDFTFKMKYKLDGNKIEIQFLVQNQGDEAMFFGLGGHPGFRVPRDEALCFEDYYLEFKEPCQPVKVGMSDDCYVTGDNEVMTLQDDKIIPLQHNMFDNDAIILYDIDKTIMLKSDKEDRSVTVSFPDMSYLGIWHSPRTDAPFICIEPWSALPSRKGVIEDIAKKSDFIKLESGKEYINSWSIQID